jgi:AraC family transcriptional regulator
VGIISLQVEFDNKCNKEIDVEPKIATLREKKLVGKHLKMSFSKNRTFELWRSFMPRRREIANNLSSDLYSVEVYEPSFFENINPEKEFDKWAAIEVMDFNIVPDEMETLILPDGLYGVFLYKGPASAGSKLYRYIFETWLPNSDFFLDNRPHFALMGEKYKNEDPNSEEEIWIPIKSKKDRNGT